MYSLLHRSLIIKIKRKGILILKTVDFEMSISQSPINRDYLGKCSSKKTKYRQSTNFTIEIIDLKCESPIKEEFWNKELKGN